MKSKIIILRTEIILPDIKTSKTKGPSWESYHLIPIPRRYRLFWPPYKIDFKLQTDVGTIETHVAGASSFPGNPMGGYYITKGMSPWFRNHSELRVDSILEATKLEDLLYSLRILQV